MIINLNFVFGLLPLLPDRVPLVPQDLRVSLDLRDSMVFPELEASVVFLVQLVVL